MYKVVFVKDNVACSCAGFVFGSIGVYVELTMHEEVFIIGAKGIRVYCELVVQVYFRMFCQCPEMLFLIL